jgi:hypothetical protein
MCLVLEHILNEDMRDVEPDSETGGFW